MIKFKGLRYRRVDRAVIHVASNGTAIVVPVDRPVTFWTFWDVWLYFAVWSGAVLGALA